MYETNQIIEIVLLITGLIEFKGVLSIYSHCCCCCCSCFQTLTTVVAVCHTLRHNTPCTFTLRKLLLLVLLLNTWPLIIKAPEIQFSEMDQWCSTNALSSKPLQQIYDSESNQTLDIFHSNCSFTMFGQRTTCCQMQLLFFCS